MSEIEELVVRDFEFAVRGFWNGAGRCFLLAGCSVQIVNAGIVMPYGDLTIRVIATGQQIRNAELALREQSEPSDF